MFHTFNIYRKLIGVQFRSQLQYRVSFLLDLLATGLIVVFEFGSIALVLLQFDHISGWTIGEIAFLYGIVEIAFGLMDMVFSGFDPSRFGQEVRKGSFDQILLRPINVTVQVLGAELVIRRLGRITMGIVVFTLALQQTEIQWTLLKLLYLPVVILSITCFFGGLFVVGATITFWTVESIEVMNIITYGGSYVMSYPMNIFQTWIRRFFTYMLPAIFLNFYPALYFLDKTDPFNLPLFTRFLSPVVGTAVLYLALRFWRFGIQHYQSTGS